MDYKIIVHPLAAQELQKSYNWYEAQQYGLGKKFWDFIEKGIDKRLIPEDLRIEKRATGRCGLIFFLF